MKGHVDNLNLGAKYFKHPLDSEDAICIENSRGIREGGSPRIAMKHAEFPAATINMYLTP
jgi:hypothetical protein